MFLVDKKSLSDAALDAEMAKESLERYWRTSLSGKGWFSSASAR